MTDRAEEIREAMVKAVHDKYPETVFLPVSDEEYVKVNEAVKEAIGRPIDAVSADTIRKCVGPWTAKEMTRALCEAAGLSWEMVDLIKSEDGLAFIHGYQKVSGAGPAIASILEAGGIERA